MTETVQANLFGYSENSICTNSIKTGILYLMKSSNMDTRGTNCNLTAERRNHLIVH